MRFDRYNSDLLERVFSSNNKSPTRNYETKNTRMNRLIGHVCQYSKKYITIVDETMSNKSMILNKQMSISALVIFFNRRIIQEKKAQFFAKQIEHIFKYPNKE